MFSTCIVKLRLFMRYTIILILTFLFTIGSTAKDIKNPKGVNVLFIMSDQHRGDFLGADGNTWVITPNLDKLANQGIMFKKAYSSTPSCTPARTAIFTGLSPWNHGMLGYMRDASQQYECEMPSLFAENGYITHAVGKNHFGPPSKTTHGYQNVKLEEAWHSTLDVDFKCDYQKWFEEVAPKLDLNATGLGYVDHRGGIPFQFADSLHATHWTAERAIDFLMNHQNSSSPWFLKVSFQRPHPPFDPPKRWLERYESIEIPLPNVGDWANQKFKNKAGSLKESPNASSGIYPDDEIIESIKAYAAGLSFMDEQIGRILDLLKETGQLENTIILYISDHGDMMGDHHMWRKCRPYEPSVRVPFIVRWPEALNIESDRGKDCSKLVELRDIFPTLADAANIDIPVKIDGNSVLKLISAPDTQWRQMLGLEHSRCVEEDNAWVALTDGRYKYIYFTLTGEEQLFDLKKDPFELNDLIQSGKYENLHKKWYQEMVHQLRIRGPRWVKDNKLQIQEKSVKTGPNFPEI